MKQIDHGAVNIGAGLKAKVVEISPAIAEAWLAHNTDNRPIRQIRIEEWAMVMTAGDWQLNGEPIIFSEHGDLMNGQHRLNAVVKSGVTITSVVVWGVVNPARGTIDNAAPRNIADHLNAAGMKTDGIRVAALARQLIAIKNSRGKDSAVCHKPNLRSGTSTITKNQALEYATEHYDTLRTSVQAISAATKNVGYGTALAALHLIVAHHLRREDDVALFLDTLNTGQANYKGDAAVALREKIMRMKMKSSREHVSQFQMLCTMVRVLDYFSKSKPMAQVYWLTNLEVRDSVFDKL